MISPNLQFRTERAETAEAWHAAVAARERARRIARLVARLEDRMGAYDVSDRRHAELRRLLMILEGEHGEADAEASAQGE